MFDGLLIFLFIFIGVASYNYLHFIINFKIMNLIREIDACEINEDENEIAMKDISFLLKNNIALSFTLLTFLNIAYNALTNSVFSIATNIVLYIIWLLFFSFYIYIEKISKDKLKGYKHLNLASIYFTISVLVVVAILFSMIFISC